MVYRHRESAPQIPLSRAQTPRRGQRQKKKPPPSPTEEAPINPLEISQMQISSRLAYKCTSVKRVLLRAKRDVLYVKRDLLYARRDLLANGDFKQGCYY